jgi:hypothetical protein
MNFTSMMALVVFIGLPPVLYYLYWSLKLSRNKFNAKERRVIAPKIKEAYFLSALSIFTVPSMLLYFLYINLLFAYPAVFLQTSLVIGIVILSFEMINFLSYEYYDKKILGGI